MVPFCSQWTEIRKTDNVKFGGKEIVQEHMKTYSFFILRQGQSANVHSIYLDTVHQNDETFYRFVFAISTLQHQPEGKCLSVGFIEILASLFLTLDFYKS